MKNQYNEPSETLLLTMAQVCAMTKMSERTVRRLVDSGAAPTPVRINRMIRWVKKTIEDWIARGCPRVR